MRSMLAEAYAFLNPNIPLAEAEAIWERGLERRRREHRFEMEMRFKHERLMIEIQQLGSRLK